MTEVLRKSRIHGRTVLKLSWPIGSLGAEVLSYFPPIGLIRIMRTQPHSVKSVYVARMIGELFFGVFHGRSPASLVETTSTAAEIQALEKARAVFLQIISSSHSFTAWTD
jgi:hypothetical protein